MLQERRRSEPWSRMQDHADHEHEDHAHDEIAVAEEVRRDEGMLARQRMDDEGIQRPLPASAASMMISVELNQSSCSPRSSII